MNKEIKIWSLGIRFFHWLLVFAFTLAYITGDEENLIHIYSGYCIIGLIVFRLILGVFGNRYSKFNNFTYSPSTVIEYTKSMYQKKPKHYLGHNPLGGLMVITMIICLSVVAISGLKVYALEEGLGPFALNSTTISLINSVNADEYKVREYHDDEDKDEELWEEIHEVSANLMVLFVLLHIAGVIISSRLHNENLARSMITGNKLKRN